MERITKDVNSPHIAAIVIYQNMWMDIYAEISIEDVWGSMPFKNRSGRDLVFVEHIL